ncbi:MAG: fibrobacter succinogenes major paralogous domain-containing protein [Bacteroidales bacterium]|nr:fibrobacter succinogenes major paralogous domain-containing protein [Bacteroidales bacterium]
MKNRLFKFKVLIIFVLTNLFISSSFAQLPNKMSYQAVIRNSSNQLVINQPVGMQISILKGSAGGSTVYSETQKPITNNNGMIGIEIGSGEGFNEIDWADGPFFIKTETDPAGGTNYTITGTNQLLSVPYAFYVETAGNIPGLEELRLQSTEMEEMLIDAGIFTVADVEGKNYKTIKMGTQVWMAENLRTSRLNDGTDIPYISDNAAWSNMTTPAHCWYKNSEQVAKYTYGGLYNWYTVNKGKLCPVGWHVPSDEEWTILENFMIANGYNFDNTTTGNKIAISMAAEGSWSSSSTTGAIGSTNTGRNASGFNARPGGYRNGEFFYEFKECWWWTSTTSNNNNAYGRSLNYNRVELFHGNDNKSLGFSVRCIKD